MNGAFTPFTFVLLVPLLPLLAAAGITARILGGVRGDFAEPPTARLATGAALGALILLLGLNILSLFEGRPGHFTLGIWFASGDLVVPVSFLLDGLSLGFATLVAAVGLVTLRFARNYLHREAGFHRFFLLMMLFLAGMLLIVLSGNVILSFIGWELCGVSSFLLIGYVHERPIATGNAQYAFLTNRIGDAGFLLGIGLTATWLGTFEWQGIAQWAAGANPAGTPPFDKVQARMLLFGFLLAATIKSAQLPFSAWIARALEGPTPSSAIFYGALMVHAGVYLTLRLEPLLIRVPDVMLYLAGIGAATALAGWLAGKVQTDVKSALIFATLSHVGLMFLACGLGLFTLAAWHMGLHAAWRAWQFLLAPSYMHLTTGISAPPPPARLAGWQWLYTAALRRFWLEPLARGVVIRPTLAAGRDLRDLDDNLLSRLFGMPERQRADADADADVIRGHGLAGRLLLWVADQLYRVEDHLVMRDTDGPLVRALRRSGDYLRVFEAMLEHPRYLVAAVALTFMVIL